MAKTKIKTSVALDKDLLDWINTMVARKRFANKTHAIEYAITILRETIEKERKRKDE
jgi:Arc/MetJ-type ribon-helix-helix transcriptional regulator